MTRRLAVRKFINDDSFVEGIRLSEYVEERAILCFQSAGIAQRAGVFSISMASVRGESHGISVAEYRWRFRVDTLKKYHKRYF